MMKRSSLQRRTALARTAMSPRRTPLKRGNSRLGLWSPSRPRVSPEERLARRLVKRRSGGWCEIQATDFSHRIREGQGGPWSASNGLHACRPCHSWVGLYPYGARAKGWALWSYEDSTREAACRRGQWVLLGDDGSVTPTDAPESAVVP